MALIEVDRRRLERLMQQMLRAYQASKSDLHEIHKQEWGTSASILGEAEIVSDQIAGHTSRSLKTGFSDATLNALQSIDFGVLAKWRMESGGKFEAFCRYLDAVEELWRAAIVAGEHRS